MSGRRLNSRRFLAGLPIALVLALAIPLLLAACGGGGGLPTIPPPTPPGAAGSPAADPMGHPTYPPGCPTQQPPALPAGETRTVTITTDKGDIVIRIEANLSPIAAGNFVALAQCGWYDGVVFHRVLPDFIIQGGDGQFGRSPNLIPGLIGTGGPPYTIKDEPVTTPYHRGTVAMARTRNPDSADSQFFIVLNDEAGVSLAENNTYQIIGNVVSGMDAVDAIAAAADAELPSNPVVMTSVTVSNP